jgi:hypothetical protein
MLPSINWTRPWYASIKTAAAKVIGHSDWQAALNQQCAALGLTNHKNLPLTFVDQAALPEGQPYESFISNTGNIPTRNNLHDFFNALVWLSFPKLKCQLNALQAAQIASADISASRGAARDAATIFDENAALLVVSDTAQGKQLVEALRGHQWHTTFIDKRDTFHKDAEVWLFGHALMEKLVQPYKSITAHAWVIIAPNDVFSMPHDTRREWLDGHVATELATQIRNNLRTACFTPLPVLGVPGWWSDQSQEFYDDTSVFRPKGGNKKDSATARA